MLLYVNDILIASFDKDHVNKLKAVLSSEFEMNDLGDAKKILGMEIIRNKERRELWVSHEVYLWNVLSDFGMDQPKSVATSMGAHFHLKSATDKEWKGYEEQMRSVSYQSAMGSIMYSMVGTSPDLAYSVGLRSRFMSRQLKEHWQAVKWLLRYIKGSVEKKLGF